MNRIILQPDDFDVGAEIGAMRDEGCGAVATFVGIVRGQGGLTSMTLEHYPAMTQSALCALADAASLRWPLSGVTIIHRVGMLVPGDQIVLVAAASEHRAAALEACAFLIDRLKTDAPFWKKECFVDGRETWVDARASDDSAASRWL
jgi:molybdopterin synthase catalytic subunit